MAEEPLLACLEKPPQRSTGKLPYSIVLPNTEGETHGAIRRSGFSSNGPQLSLFGCETSYEVFRRGVAQSPNGPCLGYRPVDSAGQAAPFVFQSYR